MDYRVVTVQRRMTADEASELIGERVGEHEANVTEPAVFIDFVSGQPVFAYLPVQGKAELRAAVRQIRYGHTTRAGTGIQNESRTFGYAPRKPVFGREGCKVTQLADEQPDAHHVLEDWAIHLEGMLEDIAPDQAKADRELLEQVGPDWRLGEGNLWTSGVVNRSSSLPYHRDGFNFPTWSAMPVLRRNMRGGYLNVPEYDLTAECRDGYAVFFPGYQLVHGVTPMAATAPDGYRYSVVYYALKGMKDCFTFAVETAYAKRKRAERERDMAARIASGERVVPIREIELDPHREYAQERGLA